MTAGPYPVLVRAISECGTATPEEVEHIVARIDRELGSSASAPTVQTLGKVRPTSIALAAAIVGADRRSPTLSRLCGRMTGTLHLTN